MYAIRSYYEAACGSCHGGRPGDSSVIATGLHTIHVAPAGANISCDDCHGAGASNGGNFSGHVNGSPEYVSTACDTCHGLEGADIPALRPVWTTVKRNNFV